MWTRKFAPVLCCGVVCGGTGTFLGYNLATLKERLQLASQAVCAAASTPNEASLVSLTDPLSPGLQSTDGATAGSSHMPMPPISRASEIMRFGYPGYDNLRTYEDYVLSYDRRNKTAHWVFEHLTPERLLYDPNVDRNRCQFREDESVHPFFRSRNDDYRASGYDRGHLAAAGNHRKTQSSVDQTFLLSNMAPQVGKGFNRDKWNELEKYTRHIAKKHRNTYVCTGPLYLPRVEQDGNAYVKYQVIGRSQVAVPTHFFKVIVAERPDGRFEMESFVLPNAPIPDSVPLREFYATRDAIERSAGFLLFEHISPKHLGSVNGRRL